MEGGEQTGEVYTPLSCVWAMHPDLIFLLPLMEPGLLALSLIVCAPESFPHPNAVSALRKLGDRLSLLLCWEKGILEEFLRVGSLAGESEETGIGNWSCW